MHRRTLLQASLLATSALAQARGQQLDSEADGLPRMSEALSGRFTKPIFIATWPFGKAACERSRDVLAGSGSLLDAVERGIQVTESDETISSVGYGGLPNADGVVQLDASFMDGATQQAGAVAALAGYPHPISVARRVMEQTKHVLLVGEDAAAFAKSQGFVARDMLTAKAREAWQKWRASQSSANNTEADKSHDTIALLGLAADGHLVGGCSTSGLAFKLPGRVGDSPLIGAGMYVDGEVGAAGATGVGENVLRYCGSFLIVEFMRQGLTPSAACEAAIRRIAASDRRQPKDLSVNFIAINKAGQVGAAGTDGEFRCAIVDATQSLVVRPIQVS